MIFHDHGHSEGCREGFRAYRSEHLEKQDAV